jgi:hypothetical protein
MLSNVASHGSHVMTGTDPMFQMVVAMRRGKACSTRSPQAT